MRLLVVAACLALCLITLKASAQNDYEVIGGHAVWAET